VFRGRIRIMFCGVRSVNPSAGYDRLRDRGGAGTGFPGTGDRGCRADGASRFKAFNIRRAAIVLLARNKEAT